MTVRAHHLGWSKLGLLLAMIYFAASVAAQPPAPRSPAAQPPTGTIAAAIRTANGTYLTAVNGGGLGGLESAPDVVPLHTDASVAGKLGTFKVVWLDSAYTKFALQTPSGNYVTAVNGGGIGGANDSSAPIHTDAKTIGEWERMRLNFASDARVTITLPDGRFLTAVNGGGVKGSSPSPIVTTDAVSHGAWETFTLVKLDAISVDSPKPPAPPPAPEPEWREKLTPAEEAVITEHFGIHPPFHVRAFRSRVFPEVLRVEKYMDYAGYMPIGTLVNGVWIEPGVYGILWDPGEATRRVLMAHGWTGLDDDRRKLLARQWVEDSIPMGWSTQTGAEPGGHALELSVEGADVIVRVWLIRRGGGIAGPRVTQDRDPNILRFKPDGSVTEIETTNETPPLPR
jgi:hypothetical protein